MRRWSPEDPGVLRSTGPERAGLNLETEQQRNSVSAPQGVSEVLRRIGGLCLCVGTAARALRAEEAGGGQLGERPWAPACI